LAIRSPVNDDPVRADRPDLLSELLETCDRALKELADADDTPYIWRLRADIIEVAHEAERLLEAAGVPFHTPSDERTAPATVK
jgi:hypothetical protein